MPQSVKAKKNSAGFLLFEVLVAVTLVSVTLVFITRGFSSALRAVRSSEASLAGAWMAEEKLEELAARLNETRDVSILDEGGRFSSPFENYSWSVESEALDDLPLRRVRLVVASDEAPEGATTLFDTYFLFQEETQPGLSP